MKDNNIVTLDSKMSVLTDADMVHLHLCEHVVLGKQTEPIAVLSKTRWVFMEGGINSKQHSFCKWYYKHCASNRDLCEAILANTIVWWRSNWSTWTKIKDHYPIRLLWKEDNPKLPDNRNPAISRMKNLDKMFKSDPALAIKYKKDIRDYTEKR